VDIKNWLVVYPYQKEPIVENFCTLAMDCSRRTGIQLSMPQTVALRDDRPDTYYNEIKNNLNESVSNQYISRTFLFPYCSKISWQLVFYYL
jgi:hypothetical protein